MKTILEPKKNVALLWRRPKPLQAVYRPMKYLIRARVDDGLLLYNVVTSEMVLLNNDEEQIFNALPAKYEAGMDEFIARHFLVTEDFDESRSVKSLRALFKKLDNSKRVSGFTILPTTDCNARCYYCFESDFERCTMTEKMANDVVDYIERVCKSGPVELSWFGGEPLVGRKRITQICEGLEKKGIRFSSSMVSNAYLFDENLIQTAKNKWKLTIVQITLDGTEEVYNKTKAFIKPKDNPYKRVVRNIQLLLDNDIVVSVRLNVTNENADDLSKLIGELSNRFSGKKGISCYSHAVYDEVGFDPLEYGDDAKGSVDSKTIQLDRELNEKGLLGSYAKLPYFKVIGCMSDNDLARVIYPDGKVGKCENRSSKDSVGDIYNDITDEKMYSEYSIIEHISECESCCMYPGCLNLRVCPETGNCSRAKQEWKTERYSALLKQHYLKHEHDTAPVSAEENVLKECES